jgi:hypothetical protein
LPLNKIKWLSNYRRRWQVKGRIYAEGIVEQGAEEDIWA